MPSGRVPTNRKRRGLATALALAAYRAFDAEEETAELRAQELCDEFVGRSEAFGGMDEASTVATRVRRAADFVRGQIPGPIRMRDVARAVGVHPVYLARLFRRLHGCTLATYARRCRVEYAVRLLEGDEPLAAVALSSGFFDQSHFTRAFQRIVGTPPAEMRRLLRRGR